MSEKAVAIVSGGMDSVTLAYLLASEGFSLHLLSVDYGQRHLKELEYAKLCAERLDAKFDVVDISGVGRLLKGSALTDDVPVPHGHYAVPNMAITVVPNRNAILLSIAYGVAVAEGAEAVATGVHAGDHFVYPDCRPEFVEAFDEMQKMAVEGFGDESLRLYLRSWSGARRISWRWALVSGCLIPIPGAATRAERCIVENAEPVWSVEKLSNSRKYVTRRHANRRTQGSVD